MQIKSLTIGLCAYNEEKTIGEALKELLTQSFPCKYEILIVASGCTDQTPQIVREFMQKHETIRLIEEPQRQGKVSAINLILKEAKGDIIFLTDADVILEKNSIKNILPHFSDPKVGAVSGRPIPVNRKGDFWGNLAWLSFDAMHTYRSNEARKQGLIHPSGYLYAIRKGIVPNIPTNTIIDDLMIGYLINSAGYKILYEPSAKVYVKFPTSFSDYLVQKIRNRAGWWQLQHEFKVKLNKARPLTLLKFVTSPTSITLALFDLIAWIGGIIYCQSSARSKWKIAQTTKTL